MSTPEATRIDRLRVRVSRMRLDRVLTPFAVLIVACWTLSITLVVVIVTPGLGDAVAAIEAGTSTAEAFVAPLWFRILIVIAGAILAAAGVAVALLAEIPARSVARRDRVLHELALALFAGFPVAALAADRAVLLAAVAAVPFVAVEVLAHRTRIRSSSSGIALIAGFAALAWVILLLAQLAAPSDRTSSWVWIALFGFAAAFAAFGGYYGVARAAESRSRRVGRLFRNDLHRLAVLGLVMLCVVIVVLRLTVARDLFPEPDPQLWSPFSGSPVSWVHAAAVAGLITVIALRASRTPLGRFGERRVVAVLAVLGNLDLAAGVVVIVAGMVVAGATGQVLLDDSWAALVPFLKPLGVLMLAGASLLPAFRGTAARWIVLCSALFLVPRTLASAFATIGVETRFDASPVQVAMLLVAVALVIAVVGVVTPRAHVAPGLVVRFAVVPLVAVHAGWLLPAALSEVGKIILVVGVLAAILILLPEVAADRVRQTGRLLNASAAQVLSLVVIALATPILVGDGSIIVLGLIWLSVTVMSALLIDTDRAASATKVRP